MSKLLWLALLVLLFVVEWALIRAANRRYRARLTAGAWIERAVWECDHVHLPGDCWHCSEGP